MNVKGNSYHYLLIWSHGIKYTDDILDMIASHPKMDIILVKHHKVGDIKEVITAVYSYDYAPIYHLRDKTEYLKKLDPEFIIIVVKLTNNHDNYYGDGKFRHLENVDIRELKNNIRRKYNPYKNEEVSHNHVIHASDNERQTDHILKYIGYSAGVNIFTPKNEVVSIPWFNPKVHKFTLKKVRIAEICGITLCRKGKHMIVGASDLPHTIGLQEDIKYYMDYYNEVKYKYLLEHRNADKFKYFSKHFDYLSPPYTNNYITVEEKN